VIRSLLVLAPLLFLAACGSDAPSAPPPEPPAEAPSHLLPADLPDAISVVDAKKKPEGEEVTVFGRVRYTGLGMFQLVDDSLDYCGRGADTMEECETPWDYCCLDQTMVARKTLVVRAQEKSGTPVARKNLGVRSLDLVAVRGVLAKNEQGGIVLVARSGWFRRERPEVPDFVVFE
jgi:hypothetical protein